MGALDNGAVMTADRDGIGPGVSEAQTPTQFVTAMGALKQWSGMTYRQLQRRAQEAGDVLPHSTIAAVLGRTSLPREEVVTAFVRACGGDRVTVEHWLAARKRIAVGTVRTAADQSGADQSGAEQSGAAADEAGADAAARRDARPANPATPEVATPEVATPEVAMRDHEPTEVAIPDHEPTGATSAGTTPGGAVPAGVNDDCDGVAGDVDGGDWFEPGEGGPTSALAEAAASREQSSWVGIHRYDPAVEVPRPSGLRWLVPPLMYRTGWATRVLSGGLCLLLVLIAVAIAVGVVRDNQGDPPTTSPDPQIVRSQNSGTGSDAGPDLGTGTGADAGHGTGAGGSGSPATGANPTGTGATAPAVTNGAGTPGVATTTDGNGQLTPSPRGGHSDQSPAPTYGAPAPTTGPTGNGGGSGVTCKGATCVIGTQPTSTPRDCSHGCLG